MVFVHSHFLIGKPVFRSDFQMNFPKVTFDLTRQDFVAILYTPDKMVLDRVNIPSSMIGSGHCFSPYIIKVRNVKISSIGTAKVQPMAVGWTFFALVATPIMWGSDDLHN